MCRYIGSIFVYDLIGFADLLIMIISSFFIIKNSDLLPGRTADFLISHTKKSPTDNIFTRILSSAKFWVYFEIITIIIAWSVCFLFSKSFGFNILNIGNDYYAVVVLTIILLTIIPYIFRLKILMLLDLLTPYLALHSAILKIACFFNGCCHGYECSFGFYNTETATVEFPIQLIESSFSLLLFFILLFLQKRKITDEGLLYPIFLITYSSVRFLAGFFRTDDKILLFFTDYQIISLSFLIIGTLMAVIILKYKNQINKILNREPFPGYMKYKRRLSSGKKTHHKKKS